MNPILSIVIPSYNKAKQLPRLLDSIVNSKCFDDTIEVIVSDDGSNDNTEKVVQKYLNKYSNINYIKYKNQGVHAARNRGMKIAKGEYIGFIDADDYFLEDGLCKVIMCLQSNLNYQVLFFPYKTSDRGEKTGLKQVGKVNVLELFEKNIFFKNKNCFGIVKKSLVQKYNISWYYTHLDSLFWRECEFHSGNLFVYEKIVGVYDKSSNNSLTKKRKNINYIYKILDAQIESFFMFIDRLEFFFVTYKDKKIACKYLDILLNLIVYSYNDNYHKKFNELICKYNCLNVKRKKWLKKYKAKFLRIVRKLIDNKNG